MTRETAYRLRRRKWSASFCSAWDAALGKAPLESHTSSENIARPARNVTLAELSWRVDTGRWHVIMRSGRYRGVRRKADNSALLTLCGRLGAAPSRIDFLGKQAR